MSANEQKATVFEAIKGGAEEYLVKPVTKKEVQNIWQYVWKRASATAADKAEVGVIVCGRGSMPGCPEMAGTTSIAIQSLPLAVVHTAKPLLCCRCC
jgi:YesN/AraC family two-component response regulator